MGQGENDFEVNGLFQFWQDVAAGRMEAMLDTKVEVMGPITRLTFYWPTTGHLLGIAEVDSRRFSYQIMESLKAALAAHYRQSPVMPFAKEMQTGESPKKRRRKRA